MKSIFKVMEDIIARNEKGVIFSQFLKVIELIK